MKALVLAAGRSTRIAAISGSRPKPLIAIEGRTVLDRNLGWLRSFGIREVWINLHYRPNEIPAAIGDGEALGVRVRYSEEEELLGTAGAVKKLEAEWDGPFLVVYGDNVFSFDLGKLVAAHQPGALITVGLFSVDEHVHSGVIGSRVTVEEDRIVGFEEGSGRVHGAGPAMVNAGCYVCSPAVCDFIPAGAFFDFGRDLFPLLIARGEVVCAHTIDGFCLGLDTPAAYRAVLEMVRSGKVKLP